MTALKTEARIAMESLQGSNVTALRRAEEGTLDYCTVKATEETPANIRDLNALEAMFAYFGTDELAA